MPNDADTLPIHFHELDEQYDTAIHIADGTFTKRYRVPRANSIIPQHSHSYSHTSYIATGSVKAWKGSEFLGVIYSPDAILIEANLFHTFQTLEDDTTILCIHALAHGEQPEIAEEHHVAVVDVPAGRPRLDFRERLTMDGFTFQDEPFEQWLADAPDLFRQHMEATGQGLDDWACKNLPLGRQLDAVGSLQILTARSSNGAMQGYIVSIIGPSLDSTTAIVAQQLPIFAAPECPGLGMKLQQASIAALKARSVTEIIGRAGVVGSGPRLGAMYRRLGFTDAGHLYKLKLEI